MTLDEFNSRLTNSQKIWYDKIQEITSLNHDIMKKLLSKIVILDSYGTRERIRENTINLYLKPNFFHSKRLFSFLLELVIENSEKRRIISKNELVKLIKENNFIRLSNTPIDSILDIFRMCTEGSIEGIVDFIEVNDEQVRIPFEEVRTISNMLLKGKTKRIVISGGGGCGKSGCIKQITQSLLNSSLQVLLIRGERYVNIKTSLELSRNLGFEEPIETLIATIAKNERTILIIDSLDVLSHNQDSINMFLDLIDRVTALKNVSILCSSRKFDLEYSLHLRDVNWDDKIFLQDLSGEEIGNVLSRLQLPQEEEILLNLKDICNTPIKLKILSKVSGDVTEGIECIWDLYRLYWRRYVIISPSTDSEIRKNLCLSIAEKMFKESSFSVLNDQIEESNAKNDLLSAGVLIPNREYISFFIRLFQSIFTLKSPIFNVI